MLETLKSSPSGETHFIYLISKKKSPVRVIFNRNTLLVLKQGQCTFYYRIHSLHRNCDICTLMMETLKSSPSGETHFIYLISV